MNAKQLRQKLKFLTSNSHLYEIQHEMPEKVATKEVARAIKSFLKANLNCDEINYSGNWCDSSGFVRKGDKYVYISFSDFRHWQNWMDDILYRTATNFKDYSGGYNQYATLDNLISKVQTLLDA